MERKSAGGAHFCWAVKGEEGSMRRRCGEKERRAGREEERVTQEQTKREEEMSVRFDRSN